MTHRRPLLVLSLLLVGALATPARGKDAPPAKAKAPPQAEAIAKLLEPIRTKHGVPGIAAAVVTSKGLVAMGATGVRRQGAEAQVTTNDLWHIGSCTKSMTATLIGRLVDEGVLRWDTTLKDAFPKLAKDMHEGWHEVTLSHLLRNRGGAPKTLERDGLSTAIRRHKGSDVEARRMLLLGVTKHAPASAPEAKYEYSNAGFAIAGHVAETVTKTPYEELIQKELFARLRMTSVGFGAPGDAQKLDQPQGHRIVGEKRVPMPPGPWADNPPAIAPAGRVHLTMQDWAKYAQLHLSGVRNGVRGLVRQATLRTMHEGTKGQDYAMGWIKAERAWGGGRVIWHNGSNTMWFAVAWLAPKKDFAVLVACNLGGDPGSKATDAAAWTLIQWHLAKKSR